MNECFFTVPINVGYSQYHCFDIIYIINQTERYLF